MSKEKWMHKLLFDHPVKACFSNVEIALRMYLSLAITNSSAERSFSKLKVIKNRLRIHDGKQTQLFGFAEYRI